ncbi:MAG: hypothetical protein Q4D81_01260 [Eubacteriales bacterium]|nr:hypothetical protein [Eubacteriales bacterium]
MATLEIIEGAEVEHGFSAVQLILLMELADAENVYTYPLPEDEDITDEHYILAMQDLMRRGLVEFEGFEEIEEEEEAPEGRNTCRTQPEDVSSSDRMHSGSGPEQAEGGSPAYRLSAAARTLLSPMFGASGMLEAVSAWEGTIPMLIYRGGGTACTASVWDGISGYIGISRMDAAELAQRLEDAGFLPGQPFDTVREARKALRYDDRTRENLARIMEGMTCSTQDPAVFWAMQENVRCVLRPVSLSGGIPDDSGRLCVFLETETESWILMEGIPCAADPESAEKVRRGQKGRTIIPDSLEARAGIWRELL